MRRRLILSLFACIISTTLGAADKPAPADWTHSVTENIRRSEYLFARTPEGPWSAPNRAHGLRTRVETAGIEVTSRENGADAKAGGWKMRLALSAFGREGRLEPLAAVEPSADAGRAEYLRDGLLEWYVNDEKGLEQGFTIHQRPEGHPGEDGSGRSLIVEMALSGDLSAHPSEDGQEILFKKANGESVLRYRALKVTDAGGTVLDARLEVQPGRLRIVIEDAGAIYPITVDPLMTVPSWTTESNQPSSNFGVSVATAGDVNGDGFSDLIVDADLFDHGQTDEGQVFVYYGSASGPPASPSWIAQMDQASAQFGRIVSCAGDVNGDGYDDIIVGAQGWDGPETDEGAAFLWYGSATGLGPDGDPNNFDWKAESNQIGAQMFNPVSAGDVNGDGYDDVLIGAWKYDNGQVDEGAAFLFYGSADAAALGPNGTPANADWRADGVFPSAQAGHGAATAGDVNGDGYDDLIVGSLGYTFIQANEGMAMLFFGGASGPGPNGTPANADWKVESNQVGAQYGIWVGTAGDVNGDGYSDMIVSARFYDNGSTDEGQIFVYQGSAMGPATTADWIAQSDQANAWLGYPVGTAGDVNGDGYADVVAGALPYDNPSYTDDGAVFVWYGGSSGLGPNGTPANADWKAGGNQPGGAHFGHSVATAGDVNGDGYGDLVVGATGFDNDQTDEGRVFLYLGSAAGPATTVAWTAEGENTVSVFGYSVASAGDVNGDGFSDVIVGAPGYDNGQTDEGRAYVYLGSASGPVTSPAWTAEGDQVSAEFGLSVASAGDVNGDGFSDVIIGARYFTNGQSAEGRAYVYLGSASGLATSPAWTAESNQVSAEFGFSVASAGDVNGDGFSDVIVGAFLYDNDQTNEGRAYTYLGSASGLETSPAWTAESEQMEAGLGYSVASAGDVNGDGFNDVIIGAYHFTNGQSAEGRAYMYLGSASGLATSPAWTAESDQVSAEFGFSVAPAGDVNGDGFSDVIVGALAYDNAQTNEGRAYIYLGSASGLATSPAWTAESDQTDALFGDSVATAGDVNGDGFSDVIIGAPKFTNGQTNEGRAYIYLGSASGLATSPAWTAESDKANARFGSSVAPAGDINGDGFNDVIIGAPEYINGVSSEGVAVLFYGNNGDGLDRTPRQARASGAVPIDLLGLSDSDNSFRLKARLRTPLGRGKVRVEYEVKPLGSPLNGSGMQRTSAIDTGSPVTGVGSAVEISAAVNGLTPLTPYHWRMRFLTDSPFFPRSPWLTLPYNSRTETDLRTDGCRDMDADGYGAPGSAFCSAGAAADCNDGNSAIHPGATELCDNLDNDCNGTADGFATSCGLGECRSTGVCDAGGDSCIPGAPSGEACDNLDNDCDGTVDSFATSCGIGQCQAVGVCTGGVDSCTPGPPSSEVCDGVDNDCNMVVDDGFPAPAGTPDVEALIDGTGKMLLFWPAMPDVTVYDVVRGSLSALWSTGGDFTAATLSCAANNLTAPGLRIESDVVKPGDAFWYVVRGVNCSTEGTYDSIDAEQMGLRDAEIEAAKPRSCP